MKDYLWTVKDYLWPALLEWAERYDDRQISDEARLWADTETGVVARPENDGAWRASMEVSFDAGRQFERLSRDRNRRR